MSREHLSIWQVTEQYDVLFTGTFKGLKKFALKQHDLMESEQVTKEELKNGDEKFICDYLNDIDLEVSEVCTITKDDFTEKTIEVGIYYYIDDDNKKVYDTEEMTREFQEKLNDLTNE